MSDGTAVFFDLDGTLLRFADYGSVVAGAFEDRLGDADPAWVDHYGERFVAYFDALAPDPYRRAMEDIVEEFDLEASPDALAEALVVRECEDATVPPGVRGTLDALAGEVALGVLTNGVPRVQRAKLDHNDLLAPFEAVVTSYDAGAHKPNPEAFAAAREALPAERYVLVGDDEAGDVEGARAAGFEAIHVAGGPFPDAERVLGGDDEAGDGE